LLAGQSELGAQFKVSASDRLFSSSPTNWAISGKVINDGDGVSIEAFAP
jgi:hypothetical protein